MSEIRFHTDEEVTQAIEDAAHAACKALDPAFPGCENGGIGSNFQGLLVEVLAHMLKGRSLLDAKRGHYTNLPTLVIDGTFFGNPLVRGEMFLLVQFGEEQFDYVFPEGRNANPVRKSLGRPVLALEPAAQQLRPIAEVGDAWTSFEGAANAAIKYLRDEGLTFEQARDLKLQVLPVAYDESRDTGFCLAETALRLVA